MIDNKNSRMKLAFSTLGCPEWRFGEILSTAKDLGYDGIEVRGIGKEIFAPKIPQFTDEKVEETKKQLRDIAIEIPCLAADSMIHLPHFADHSKASIRKYIKVAQAIGTPYVRLLSDMPNPHPTAPVDVVFMKDVAQELAEDAKAAGVTLLLESHGWFTDTQRLARLLEDIASPFVQALWDVHHPYRYGGESAEDTIANIGSYIKHTHFKDSLMVDEKPKYMMMGYGDLPLESFIEALRGMGYQGYYCLEWVRRWDLTLEVPGIAFDNYINYMNRYK
ncbi:MAG: sugar phosphate isomerase/epimerase family protein [Christensenellales bacterium]|jgi:fatty-acyl-CoA synthase